MLRIRGPREVTRDALDESRRLELEPLAALPHPNMGERLLGPEVVEHPRACAVELGRVDGHRDELLDEGRRAEREAPRPLGRALLVPAQVHRDARGLVGGQLAHDHVGHARDGRGYDHPNCVETHGVIEREGRRRKVLANPLEQEEKFELLGVQHRGAPHAGAFGLLAVRQGHGQQRRERVLHKRGDQEGRVKHGMRLDHRERAERVALDEHCHALGKGPRAKRLRIGRARRDGLRLRQKVDRFVLG